MMNSILPEELELWESLVNKTPGGPWEVSTHSSGGKSSTTYHWIQSSIAVNEDGDPAHVASAQDANTARFIAVSKLAIKRLLAEIRNPEEKLSISEQHREYHLKQTIGGQTKKIKEQEKQIQDLESQIQYLSIDTTDVLQNELDAAKATAAEWEQKYNNLSEHVHASAVDKIQQIDALEAELESTKEQLLTVQDRLKNSVIAERSMRVEFREDPRLVPKKESKRPESSVSSEGILNQLKAMYGVRSFSAGRVMVLMDVDMAVARRRLDQLEKEGKVVKYGCGKGDFQEWKLVVEQEASA